MEAIPKKLVILTHKCQLQGILNEELKISGLNKVDETLRLFNFDHVNLCVVIIDINVDFTHLNSLAGFGYDEVDVSIPVSNLNGIILSLEAQRDFRLKIV